MCVRPKKSVSVCNVVNHLPSLNSVLLSEMVDIMPEKNLSTTHQPLCGTGEMRPSEVFISSPLFLLSDYLLRRTILFGVSTHQRKACIPMPYSVPASLHLCEDGKYAVVYNAVYPASNMY